MRLAEMKEIEAMKTKLEGLKEEFTHNKGAKRVATKKTYSHLLRKCGKKCGLEERIEITIVHMKLYRLVRIR
jgi:hypothetical protein